MVKLLLSLLLILNAQLAFGQPERSPFHVLMDTAKVKKLIAVDTVAGKTNVLLTTNMDDPAFVFVFAPGGDGTLTIEASADGTPFTKRVRNPAYFSAPNLSELPFSWEPRQAKAPIMFITHENDDCGIQYRRLPISTLTKRAAGNSFPLTVIKSPSPGNHQECFAAPAPHFFTDVYGEYTDAITKWALSLK